MPINPSPAVLRACDLLEVLAESPTRRFSVSELARLVGVPRATCDSLMLAFLERGWVSRDDELRYALTAHSIRLADAARQANPALEVAATEAGELARRLHACVAVSVRDGHHIRITDVADFSPPFSMSARAGQSVPVRAPFAAVFVAWESDEVIEQWLADSHPDAAARAHYIEAIGEVRRLGFSVTVNRDRQLLDRFAELSGSKPSAHKAQSIDEVFHALVETHHLPAHIGDEAMRVSLMSAPVFDARGSVACSLMVLGSSELMSPSDLQSLAAALMASAASVSRAIGGQQPPRAA
jgi:DNA-binding IclR family transcriptional regulator